MDENSSSGIILRNDLIVSALIIHFGEGIPVSDTAGVDYAQTRIQYALCSRGYHIRLTTALPSVPPQRCRKHNLSFDCHT